MEHLKGLNIAEVKKQMWANATERCNKYIDEHLGGKDMLACGFGWVTVYPKHKGNTKEGRHERKVLRQLGFEVSYDKTFTLHSPYKECFQARGQYFQNVDCQLEAAKGMADILSSVGFDAYGSSRLD